MSQQEFYETVQLAEEYYMTQPEALRLADAMQELDGLFSRTGACGEAAAELRRLHEVNAELLKALNDLAAWGDGAVGGHMDEPYAAQIARAAIAKATGEHNEKLG